MSTARTTPIPYRPVGANGVTRWIGGVDPLPAGGGVAGIGNAAVTFGPGDLVDLYPPPVGDGPAPAPKGHLVHLEVIAPTGDDVLWVCFGAYDHARAWPVLGGERFEHNAHLQGIDSISFRATDGIASTSAPSAPITPRVRAEWDRRG